MQRRPRLDRFALPLLAVCALCVLVACAGTAPKSVSKPSPPSGEGGGRASRELDGGAGPSLVDAPRVRRLSRSGWVEVEAAVLASDEESPASARRRAIGRARQAAVEFVAGVSVRSSVVTLDFQKEGGASDLLQALTATQADALVIDEKLVQADVEITPTAGYRASVRLQARVLARDPVSRDAFDAEVEIDRTSYRAGERVELAVRASADARIYVLNVSDEGATLLLPNRHMPETIVRAHEWLRFPGALLAERGIALEATLPDGQSESQEALIVVALRGERRLQDLFPASGAGSAAAFRSAESDGAMALVSEFLSPLLSIPADDWTFDQRVYRILSD